MSRFGAVVAALLLAVSLLTPSVHTAPGHAAQDVWEASCTGADDEVVLNQLIGEAQAGDVLAVRGDVPCVLSGPVVITRPLVLQGTSGGPARLVLSAAPMPASLEAPGAEPPGADDLPGAETPDAEAPGPQTPGTATPGAPRSELLRIEDGPTTLRNLELVWAGTEPAGAVAVADGVAVTVVDVLVVGEFLPGGVAPLTLAGTAPSLTATPSATADLAVTVVMTPTDVQTEAPPRSTSTATPSETLRPSPIDVPPDGPQRTADPTGSPALPSPTLLLDGTPRPTVSLTPTVRAIVFPTSRPHNPPPPPGGRRVTPTRASG